MGTIIFGLVINMISGGSDEQDFGGAGWKGRQILFFMTALERY